MMEYATQDVRPDAVEFLGVDKRFAQKQQMQGSKGGAHRLVQVRTRTLDGTLRRTFAAWYPAMAANDSLIPAAVAAA